MKKINALFLFVFASMVSCHQSPNFSEATLQGLSALPANAIKEPYDSNPDLVKVTIPGTGGVSATGDYLMGKRSGAWSEFHSNGVVKSVTGYVAGAKQGPYFTIDDNGQLQVSAYYHKGQLHGEWKQFNRSRIKEERTYVNGKLEGMTKIYYTNGNIMEEGNYADGVRDGISKWYDQEGNPTIEYEYKQGQLVKK